MSLSSTYKNIDLTGSTTVTLTDLSLADNATVAYNIYGVTSSDINNEPLSGNFTITSGTADLTITATTDSYRLITIMAAGYDPISISVYERLEGPPIIVDGNTPKQLVKFIEPGTYTWTVPQGITEVTATVVGGGGGGILSTSGGSGGGGGDLRYNPSLPVSGTVSIVVGAGGLGGGTPTAGGISSISVSGSEVLVAAGGGAGRANAVSNTKNGFSTSITGGSVPITYSVLFDGTSDSLSITSSNIVIGTGDYTLEFWAFAPSALSGWRDFFTHATPGIMFGTNGGVLNAYNQPLGAVTNGTFPINQWNHVVFCRNNGTSRCFLNGTFLESIADNTNWGTVGDIWIGSYTNSTEVWPGNISNLRFSDIARFTSDSNFLPPTEPYSSDTDTKLLVCKSSTIIDNSDNPFTVNANGDAQVSNINPFGSTFVSNGIIGGDGGIGVAAGSTSNSGGGGGAGGYTGNGGNGGSNAVEATAGSGGGGGGGGGSPSTYTSGSGGGVNIFGPGPSGAAGAYAGGGNSNGAGGGGGSFGADGQSGNTGIPFSIDVNYGGGGGGSDNGSTLVPKTRPGGNGAVSLFYQASNGVYASNREQLSGVGFSFVIVDTAAANGSTRTYTITGVTSAEINGAALSGTLTFYNKTATLNLVGSVDEDVAREVLLTVTDIGSAATEIRGILSYFPPAYRSMISSFTGVKKYIFTRSGSDSNDGDSFATAYATTAYATTQTDSTLDPVMFVVGPGSYIIENLYVAASASFPITDNSRPRVYVCAPGRTEIKWMVGPQRDAPLANFGNSGSAIYGATFLRDNNFKTTNYTVAFFNNTTAQQVGNFYNCAIREIGSNGNWSLQYGSCTTQVNNCTFYTTTNGANDYSGGAALVFNDCVFNYSYGTGSATKNNTLVNQTVDPVTYETSNLLRGVYSGQNYWAPKFSRISITRDGAEISSAEERNIVKFTYLSSFVEIGTVNYAISGISANDLASGDLSGTLSLTDYRGSVSVTLKADYDFSEGTETLIFSVGGVSSSLDITDLPSALYLNSTSVTAGEELVVTLIVNNLAQGTLVPYTITGVAQESINVPLQGSFVIDDNNSSELAISTGTVPGAVLAITADGSSTSATISFTPSFQDSINSIGIESNTNSSYLPIYTRDFVNQITFPTRKNFREVDESSGMSVILPLGVELVREYWI